MIYDILIGFIDHLNSFVTLFMVGVLVTFCLKNPLLLMNFTYTFIYFLQLQMNYNELNSLKKDIFIDFCEGLHWYFVMEEEIDFFNSIVLK